MPGIMPQPFQTIALVGKYNSPDIAEALNRLAAFILSQGRQVLVEQKTADNIGALSFPVAPLAEIGRKADLVVVLGGDGTMLNVACELADFDVYLIGINQGRLGFLTDLFVEDMLPRMADLLRGEFQSEQRFLLQATVLRGGQPLCENMAFNDVVITKGVTARLIEFEVSIDGQFVYSQRSDGLIVSTPTGSTAYAMSAGGPILHPSLAAFVLVPICPHTLSNRPIAVNSLSTVEIEISHAVDAVIHFDGQRHVPLQIHDRVIIYRSRKRISLLHPSDHSYFDTLRQKLRWGEKLES